MAAQIDFQMTWIKTGPSFKTSTNPQDFLINDHQDLLPEVFPTANSVSSYVLYHQDLSLANILVNPDTYEITDIIDWEKIQVVPERKNSRFPKFLTDQMDFEKIDDNEPRIPTPAEYDEDNEDQNPVVVRRDR